MQRQGYALEGAPDRGSQRRVRTSRECIRTLPTCHPTRGPKCYPCRVPRYFPIRGRGGGTWAWAWAFSWPSAGDVGLDLVEGRAAIIESLAPSHEPERPLSPHDDVVVDPRPPQAAPSWSLRVAPQAEEIDNLHAHDSRRRPRRRPRPRPRLRPRPRVLGRSWPLDSRIAVLSLGPGRGDDIELFDAFQAG